MPPREYSASYLPRRTGFVLLIVVTAALLCIPLMAMQFTHEVNWTSGDFLVAGALLLGTGSLYLIAAGWMKTRKARVTLGTALLFALLLVWAQLAVGIF
jgi:hypothetical protein